MKKIIIVLTVILTGVGIWQSSQSPQTSTPLAKNEGAEVAQANPTATKPAEKKFAATNHPQSFDSAKAQEVGQLADRVAQAKMPEIDVSKLSQEEVDAKLKEIDEKLGDEDLVDRVNRNQLSESELVEVRTLLHLRTKYFSRRVQLALNKP